MLQSKLLWTLPILRKIYCSNNIIKPTITIEQGSIIKIYVNKDYKFPESLLKKIKISKMSSNFVALETFLLPFKELFAEDGINEIMINKSGEVWIEKRGELFYKPVPVLDFDHLIFLSRLVAQSTEQIISEDKLLFSASLPNGYRIQIIFPPVCEAGIVGMLLGKAV